MEEAERVAVEAAARRAEAERAAAEGDALVSDSLKILRAAEEKHAAAKRDLEEGAERLAVPIPELDARLAAHRRNLRNTQQHDGDGDGDGDGEGDGDGAGALPPRGKAVQVEHLVDSLG